MSDITSTTRVRRLVIIGAALALATAAVWAITANRDGENLARASKPPADDMAGMQGMKMDTGGSVRLTSVQLAQFGITFGTAEERVLTSDVRTAGSVTIDETRIVQVSPRFSGYAERLYVDFTGHPVRRGQPLLEIYSPELLAAQQELLIARGLDSTVGQSAVPGVPDATSDLLGAAKQRLRLWDISEAQIEEVLRTGHVRRTLTLYSPASGVVTEKNIVRGQAVEAGMTLYTIADLSVVWVDVGVREADASAVTVGAGADVEVTGLPGRGLKGRVGYVYPMLDTTSRTVRARIIVANSQGLLKPGMYATVRLSAPGRRALTVPSSAVIRTGERNIVFVDMGGGNLMPHEVELGQSASEYTEVLSGIDPGQRVVTSAQFLLESESNLGEVMKAMMGQMGPADSKKMDDMPGMSVPR